MEYDKSQFARKLLARSIAAGAALTVCAAPLHAERALEEVIVTAQKKDDTVQTVPMTVNAITADAIEKYQLLDFKDVATVTPGLTIKPLDSRNATIAMRGVNVITDAAFGVGVAIYWNEVTYDIDSAYKAMYDIGQVEVLRGPQGTLRGVTAPAGSVTFATRLPNYNAIDGSIEQTFSDNGLANTQAAASLPLIEDKLALRVAGLYDHSYGADIKDYNTGKRSRSLTSSGRMTLGFRPTDDLEANLIYQYMDADQTGGPAMRGCGTAFQQGCIGTYDRKSVDQGPDDSLGRRQITALKIDWSLGDYELASVTGYQDQHMDVIRDNDDPGNAVEIAGLQGVLTEIHNFTQEVRFSTADADFWNWTVGAYYARLVSNTQVGTQLVIPPFPNLGLAEYLILPVHTSVAANTEDTGLFTNHSLQFTEALEAQIGVRYQSHRQTNFLRTTSDGLAPFIPSIDSVGADNAKVNEAITGSASLSYQLNDDMRIYASYGRSFRGGGYTTAPTTQESLLEYDPETSDSLELGFKGRLADGRVQVSGDVYYQKYHDFLGRTGETIRSINSPQNGNDTLNFNANALVRGAEMQVDALLTDQWRAGMGVSYTDAKYTDGAMPCNLRDANGTILNPVAPAIVNTCDAHGRLAGEPNWGFTANSEYTRPLGGFEGFVRGQYVFSSGRANDFIAGSLNDTASYGVFNLFTGVRNAGGDWEVSVWSKNLFDKKATVALGGEASFTDVIGNTTMSGYQSVQTIPRREIGITGKYNFSM